MLDYLKIKYGETFTPVDTKDDPYLPPVFRDPGVLVVHPESSPDDWFFVAENKDKAGQYKDERVLAAWSRWYEDKYRAEIDDMFGEGASFRVQLASPDSWQFGQDRIDDDPSGFFSNPAQASAITFLVAVPVSPGFALSDYAQAITKASGIVRAANTGDGFPQLTVYFYNSSQDVTRYLDLRSIPGASIAWDSMPGAVGVVAVNRDTAISTEADVLAAYTAKEDVE